MCIRRFSPFSWSRRTITIVTLAFFAIAIPSYLLGFSAFATTINPVNATLKIPSIRLSSYVTPAKSSGNELETPNEHVASYTNENKVFLFAHSTANFKNLDKIIIGDTISYLTDNSKNEYQVTKIETVSVDDILMSKLLKNTEQPTLILMTCAGQKIDGQYQERLLIYAE